MKPRRTRVKNCSNRNRRTNKTKRRRTRKRYGGTHDSNEQAYQYVTQLLHAE